MDQASLQKIARLRTLAARQGKNFDVVRFATDREFALQTLTAVMDTTDEELLMAGLELMNSLRMIPEPQPAAPPAAAKPAGAPSEPSGGRYVGRLR
ncbi:hypothetical protein [Caldimonas tepidiphila]|uniref:hypothetical protein n=1 Tax=Caldimonas tepidiphila TaxID=2315841 RepID=UPI000E5B86AC|nr:hypothetical protein [Caldimonas tepidiphila]